MIQESYSQFEGICKEAANKLREAIKKNIDDILADLSKMPKSEQKKITSSMNMKGVDDFLREEASRLKREKYPHKDKNQIKFQVDDRHMQMARRFIKMYRIKSVPALARKLLEMYLNSFYAEEKMPDDIDFVELFDDLSDGYQKDDFNSTKRGASI